MRRKAVSFLVASACALGTAGIAAAEGADDPGLAPVDPNSPGARAISDTYFFVLGWSVLVFLLVTVPLVYFVVRNRHRGPRDAVAPQVHGNTRLELVWTAVPILILVGIVGFVLMKLPGVNDVARGSGGEEPMEIAVEGRQFYWQYLYPGGAIGVDRLRLPQGQNVELKITGGERDVIHSFWVPALGGKFDAIPGHTNSFHVRPERVGVFEGVCGEFCGLQHAAMIFEAEVLPAEEFDRWLEEETQAQEAGRSDLGRTTYVGACAKCHGLAGEGMIGPPLAGNALIEDREGLRRIVYEGQGEMPAVGEGWTDRQYDALYEFLSEDGLQEESADSGS